MKATAKLLTGRKIRIQGTADAIGYNTTVTDAKTGEMIENVESIQITIKARDLIIATLTLVHSNDKRDFGTRYDIVRSLVEVKNPEIDIYAYEDSGLHLKNIIFNSEIKKDVS